MVNLLRLLGVEVHRATKEFSVKDQKYPAGSYVVRMDQPYSRMADMLLDTQYYNVNDPAPYDDTGWTLGPMRNVKTVRVTDKSVLDAPMTLLTADAKVTGQLSGPASAAAYVINHNTDNTLATLRFKLKDVKMSAAEDSFKIGDQQFNAGSFIMKTDGNPADLRATVGSGRDVSSGLTAVGVDKLPEVKTHELAVPRIAILHTWTNTQNEGWYRIEFDRLQIPYTYISDQVIRNTPNLREKFDVIIFPPVGGSAQTIVNGIPMRGDPIPWKAVRGNAEHGHSPDQTDDMRGGMGWPASRTCKSSSRTADCSSPSATCSQIPIDFGITTGVSIQEARQAAGARFDLQRDVCRSQESDRLWLRRWFADLLQSGAAVSGAAGGGGGGFGGGGGGQGGGGAAACFRTRWR